MFIMFIDYFKDISCFSLKYPGSVNQDEMCMHKIFVDELLISSYNSFTCPAWYPDQMVIKSSRFLILKLSWIPLKSNQTCKTKCKL
jgi:hypothetical protein